MKFKSYISTTKKDVINIQEKSISEKDFLNGINSYTSINAALANLPEEYTEYYLLNINSKSLNKQLKDLHIQGIHETNESILGTADRTLGFAPTKDRIIKNIKYKGQYITVEYDRELGSWFPAIRFRSIISALKFIKDQVDYDTKQV